MPLFRIFFALALLASFAANAASVTEILSFTATGFTPQVPGAVPVATVTGSVTVTYDPTVDLTNGAPDSLSLTIGSHTYALGEVGVTIHSLGYFVGALAGGGLGTVDSGIDDFEFRLNPDGSFHHFIYSVAGISNTFTSFSGDSSVTTRTVRQDVPEPATAALFGGGLLAVGWLRRRRAQA